jgi:hypothetical protein
MTVRGVRCDDEVSAGLTSRPVATTIDLSKS